MLTPPRKPIGTHRALVQVGERNLPGLHSNVALDPVDFPRLFLNALVAVIAAQAASFN
ncbi:MAG TPA: hypothetical protein VJT50_04175 [Pyrinomonadaceae bacterium]|nr:hypothetical protein [Pyrinomonadaceae bacterium]